MKRKYVMMIGAYDLATGDFSKFVFEKDGHEFTFTPPLDAEALGHGRFLIMDQSDSPGLIEIIADKTGR